MICWKSIFIFTFCGCDYFGPGTADYSYHISNKYKIYRPSSINLELIKEENRVETVVVSSMVTGIAWDENFIL